MTMNNPAIEEHFNRLMSEAEDSVIALYPNEDNGDQQFVVMASASNGSRLLTNSATSWGRARHIVQQYFGDILNLYSSHNIVYIEVPAEEISDAFDVRNPVERAMDDNRERFPR